MDLPIIYEDKNIVAVDKPVGVMTHPDGRNAVETASDWFAKKYPESREVGEMQLLPNGTSIARPGVVHRLDRETSGVLIFTKTPEAHAFLKEAFQNHDVKKTYFAFVYGVPKERKGTIDFAIGRSRQDFRLRSAQPKAKGILREAITNYKILTDIGTHSLMQVEPKTGRTHQIRVHLKAIHHPIVGDPLYAPNQKADLGFNRLGLHAARIDIPLLSGERLTISSPLPPDLQKGLQKFPDGAAAIATQ